MDIKDILLQNENSLPTLDSMSTSTVQAQIPTITATPATYAKFAASGIMGLLGAYYLYAGKRQNDVQKMITGAVLTVASMLCF